MPKLIVNPDTDQSWDIPLEPGVTVLGSDPASPFAIAHDTVAPTHCEIWVNEGVVTIKDLGSACGTFVDHAAVTESPLTSGQSVTLGEVDLQFVSDAPQNSLAVPRRIATPIRARVVNPAGAPVICRYHRTAPATWHCGTCNLDFCDLCVNVRRVGDAVRHLCRTCGNDCTQLAVRHTEPPPPENFFNLLPRAFIYPFVGSGPILIVAGAVFLSLAHLAARFTGIVGLLIGVGTAGYLFSFLKQVVATSAHGSKEAPDWPDFSNFSEDLLAPFGQMIALMVLAFGPALVLAIWKPFGADYNPIAVLVAIGAGALIAPMGMLALAVLDHVGALNPVALVWSICRIPCHT